MDAVAGPVGVGAKVDAVVGTLSQASSVDLTASLNAGGVGTSLDVLGDVLGGNDLVDDALGGDVREAGREGSRNGRGGGGGGEEAKDEGGGSEHLDG